MRPVLLAAAAAVFVVTGAAAAQRIAASPATTILGRQLGYKQMAAAMKGINEEMGRPSPWMRTIQGHTSLLATRARQVLTWFPPGTGPETGVRTRALPAVWSNRPGFERAGARLLIAARAMDAAARRRDLAGVRAAFAQVRSACGGCHDDFRGPE